jgi:hypothetical protein
MYIPPSNNPLKVKWAGFETLEIQTETTTMSNEELESANEIPIEVAD